MIIENYLRIVDLNILFEDFHDLSVLIGVALERILKISPDTV